MTVILYKKESPSLSENEGLFSGAPSRARIHNLLVRSQTLYPIELWVQLNSSEIRISEQRMIF